MLSRFAVVVSYWVVVGASVIASLMAADFVGTMWPQITAYSAATTKALALIFILLPICNLVLLRLTYANRLAVAIGVIAAQASILYL